MIDQLPENNGFIPWITGLAVAGFGALFAFIKYLVGIQVKKIDKLTEEVNDVKNKVLLNTAYDKMGNETVKDKFDLIQNQLDTLQDRIDGNITHAIRDLEKKMNECKYCNLKK